MDAVASLTETEPAGTPSTSGAKSAGNALRSLKCLRNKFFVHRIMHSTPTEHLICIGSKETQLK